MRPEDDPIFASQGLADLLTSTACAIDKKLAYCRDNPVNAIEHPVLKAMVDVYMYLLELMANDMRRGAIGLLEQYKNRPSLRQSIEDLESWIFRPKKDASHLKLTTTQEEEIGDFLVGKMNFSFSRAVKQIDIFKRSINPKGAPPKRVETLRMLDARIANGWSYSRLASEFCDCGKSKHDQHCADSIRKRIKELEAFLARYKIAFQKPDGNPEKKQP